MSYRECLDTKKSCRNYTGGGKMASVMMPISDIGKNSILTSNGESILQMWSTASHCYSPQEQARKDNLICLNLQNLGLSLADQEVHKPIWLKAQKMGLFAVFQLPNRLFATTISVLA